MTLQDFILMLVLIGTIGIGYFSLCAVVVLLLLGAGVLLFFLFFSLFVDSNFTRKDMNKLAQPTKRLKGEWK